MDVIFRNSSIKFVRYLSAVPHSPKRGLKWHLKGREVRRTVPRNASSTLACPTQSCNDFHGTTLALMRDAPLTPVGGGLGGRLTGLTLKEQKPPARGEGPS